MRNIKVKIVLITALLFASATGYAQEIDDEITFDDHVAAGMYPNLDGDMSLKIDTIIKMDDNLKEELYSDLAPSMIGGDLVGASTAVSNATVMLAINGSLCSGVVINKTTILTAAHCLSSKPRPPLNTIRVYLGAKKVFQGSPKSFVANSRFDLDRNNLPRADVAIIRMAKPMAKSVPIPLMQSLPSTVGVKLIAAGFGYSDRAKTKIQVLRSGSFVLGETAGYEATTLSDGSRVLVLLGRKNVCNGDSGGPTFAKTALGLRVVGIHSMANCKDTGIDVVPYFYRSWISNQLN